MSEWVLVVVSKDAKVSAPRFATKREAEIALSIALYGMTPDEREAAKAADQARVQKQRDAFTASHPPRKPRDHEKKQIAEGQTYLYGGGCGDAGGMMRMRESRVTPDGLVQDCEWWEHDFDSSNNKIKWTSIFIADEKAPRSDA